MVSFRRPKFMNVDLIIIALYDEMRDGLLAQGNDFGTKQLRLHLKGTHIAASV